MSNRIIPLLAAVSVALMAIACGDDDAGEPLTTGTTGTPGLSAEEEMYFLQLGAALTQANEALPVLEQLRSMAFAADADASAITEYGEAYEQFMETRDTAIRDITAPEALTSQHSALALATGDTLEFALTLNAELQTNPPATESEFVGLLAELDAVSINQRFRDACTRLQILARTNEIDTDLGCLQ